MVTVFSLSLFALLFDDPAGKDLIKIKKDIT